MTNCRIELEGIESSIVPCNAPDIRVSRTQPVALSMYMNGNNWQTFCDEVDGALLPVSKWRKIIGKATLGYLVLFVTLFVCLFLVAFAPSQKYSTGSLVSIFSIAFGTFLGYFSIIFGLQRFGISKTNTATLKIQEICAKTTNQYSDLSFQYGHVNVFFRRRRNLWNNPNSGCITVSINLKKMNIATMAETRRMSAMFATRNSVAAKSVERLEQLDKMNGL